MLQQAPLQELPLQRLDLRSGHFPAVRPQPAFNLSLDLGQEFDGRCASERSGQLFFKSGQAYLQFFQVGEEFGGLLRGCFAE